MLRGKQWGARCPSPCTASLMVKQVLNLPGQFSNCLPGMRFRSYIFLEEEPVLLPEIHLPGKEVMLHSYVRGRDAEPDPEYPNPGLWSHGCGLLSPMELVSREDRLQPNKRHIIRVCSPGSLLVHQWMLSCLLFPQSRAIRHLFPFSQEVQSIILKFAFGSF